MTTSMTTGTRARLLAPLLAVAMVAVAAATQFLSAPGQSYSVATFKEPMRRTLLISSIASCFATCNEPGTLPTFSM